MRDPQDLRKIGRDPQSDDRWRLLNDRARVEGRKAWLDLLHNRLLWNDAPSWAQDSCADAAADGLGPSYQFLGFASSECGGESHRLASFRFLGPDPSNPLPQKNPLDWVFRLLPGGDFSLGSEDWEEGHQSNEEPSRELYIPPLLMGATPVTQSMWTSLEVSNPSEFKEDSRPVETVPWGLMQGWIQGLGGALRLPSEAEWEYACRAGTSTSYCFDDFPEDLADYAWYSANSNNTTHPVAQLKANAFGLYDVHGNIWEWCQDAYESNYSSGPRDHSPRERDPRAPRVQRGGGWMSPALACRSASRAPNPSGHFLQGFRLAAGLST